MTCSPFRLAAAAVAVACGLVLPACAGGGSEAGGQSGGAGLRLRMVASFYPIAHAATRVGGDRVRVTNLTPVGVEPHDLELTPRQVDQLESADLLLYVGQGFQPAVAAVAKRRHSSTLDVMGSVQLDPGEGGRDPHFWLDPVRMRDAVQAIADAMAKASPADAARFQANAALFKGELGTLDAEFRQGLANCERKEIVTSHAAFHYLAARYGLTQRSVAGLSPEAEPDPARLATLVDEIKAKGITTVFYEELGSPKVAQTLAREAGAQTAALNPLEGLSKSEVDAGKDYTAVMRENLGAIRTALGCQ